MNPSPSRTDVYAAQRRPAQALGFGLAPLLFLLAMLVSFALPPELAERLARYQAPLIFGLLVAFAAAACVATRLLTRAEVADSLLHEQGERQALLVRQTELLAALSDLLPRSIMVVDYDGRIQFANREAGRQVGSAPEQMQGRLLEQVLRPVRAQQIIQRLRQAQGARAPVIALEKIDPLTAPRHVQTSFIPLPAGRSFPNAFLITEDDVTGIMAERERRESMLEQLLDTFVAVIDRRDPYAAGHSLRVGQVARAIAEEMNLDRTQQETASMAGTLMNFGKILVPRQILTKTAALSEDELRQVRESILQSADILSLINFDLPVVPTLRQVLERVDGGGLPDGRRADDILLTARIVAVANAFVALVSPRAHRPGLPVEPVIAQLMQEIGKAYDRRVVVALANYLENRASRLDWLRQLQTTPKAMVN